MNAITIQAIYENGVFRPLEAVSLPPNTTVELCIQPAPPGDRRSTLARLLEIADRYPDNPDAPADLAAQHDHYLYGSAKKP